MKRFGKTGIGFYKKYKSMNNLSEKESARYARQIMLNDIGNSGQELLKAAKVLVVGAGGLGAPVSQYLCAAGIGEIGIVDNDIVSVSNLQRQVLYTTSNQSRPKVEIAKQRLNDLNPFCKINVYKERLDAENAFDIISNYHIVVDCTDNFKTRYLLDEVCGKLKKPLVYGSIEDFSGQLTVFHYREGVSYASLFPEKPSKELMNGQPLGVMGAIPGVIGSLQATEVIKIITGVGEVLCGTLLLYDALKASFLRINCSE